MVLAAVFGLAVLAGANADAATDRSIDIYSIHTKESLSVVYKRDGRYIPGAMGKINTLLRDWRVDETITIDPALIDLIWELRRELGSTEPVQLISGHRSERTNAMLRRRRGGQAKRSLHIAGKAMDVFFPGVPLAKLRNAALVKQSGGVGYYPRSGTPFVHIDTGSIRHWPRIPERQLAAIMKGKGKYGATSPTRVAGVARTSQVPRRPERAAPLVLASASSPAPSSPAGNPVGRRWGESWLTPTRRAGPQPRRKPRAPAVVTAQNGTAEFPLGVVSAYARPDRAGSGDKLTAMIEGTPTALPDLLSNPGLMRELSDGTPSGGTPSGGTPSGGTPLNGTPGSEIQMPSRPALTVTPTEPIGPPIITASLAPDVAPPGRTPSLIAARQPALGAGALASARRFSASPFDRPSRQRFAPTLQVITKLIGTPANKYTNVFKGQLFATKMLYTFSVADRPGYLVAGDVTVAIAPPQKDRTPVLIALAKRAYAWLTGG